MKQLPTTQRSLPLPRAFRQIKRIRKTLTLRQIPAIWRTVPIKNPHALIAAALFLLTFRLTAEGKERIANLLLPQEISIEYRTHPLMGHFVHHFATQQDWEEPAGMMEGAPAAP